MQNFFSPIITLYTYFPEVFFIRLLIVFLLSIFTVCAVRELYISDRINKLQRNASCFVFCYFYLVLFFTVLGRRTKERDYPPDFEVFEPFLKAFASMDFHLILELLVNILIFVPIGVGLYLMFKNTRYSFLKSLGITIVFSLIIEVLQFLLSSGYFEISDIIKYLLGTCIGYGVIILIDCTKGLKNSF